MRGLVLEYYVVLRATLRARPHLRRCLTRCKYCRIFFFTHPCNASRYKRKRRDLSCPFGCREAHRKKQSTRRSVAYYRTQEGKLKKSTQNGRRRRAEGEPEGTSRPDAGQGEWNGRIVEHVRMVTSLIEGRRVRLSEILKMLARALRQHSLGRKRRIDYIVGRLNKASP